MFQRNSNSSSFKSQDTFPSGRLAKHQQDKPYDRSGQQPGRKRHQSNAHLPIFKPRRIVWPGGRLPLLRRCFDNGSAAEGRNPGCEKRQPWRGCRPCSSTIIGLYQRHSQTALCLVVVRSGSPRRGYRGCDIAHRIRLGQCQIGLHDLSRRYLLRLSSRCGQQHRQCRRCRLQRRARWCRRRHQRLHQCRFDRIGLCRRHGLRRYGFPKQGGKTSGGNVHSAPTTAFFHPRIRAQRCLRLVTCLTLPPFYGDEILMNLGAAA